jgi:hypothetical protein
MIAHVEKINDIIKDFVAIGFIVEIDDYFASNLPKCKMIEDQIEEYNETLVIEEPESDRAFVMNFLKYEWNRLCRKP